MMCDNQHNFAQPWDNNFYYHYLQQHATMSYHFQKLHSNIHHYENQFFDMYNPADVCNHADCNSLCSSSSSCCSSGSCSETSSEYEEQEQIDNEEGYDKEQYEVEDYDEDESECEYEFNVDAILAMRAAKEELKKQEQAESKNDESSESKDDESPESKYDESSESNYDESSESSDDESSESNDDESSESKDDESVGSKDERDSKSDNTAVVDSDKDDFEFIDLSKLRIMDCNLYRRVGGFNRCEEVENKKLMMEYLYGSQGNKIVGLESHTSLNFDQECDDNQPSLWPVLPLRL